LNHLTPDPKDKKDTQTRPIITTKTTTLTDKKECRVECIHYSSVKTPNQCCRLSPLVFTTPNSDTPRMIPLAFFYLWLLVFGWLFFVALLCFF